ncbi:MAG: hypothetical protein ACJAVA_002673 [Flavobacteriaceae bacterium]
MISKIFQPKFNKSNGGSKPKFNPKNNKPSFLYGSRLEDYLRVYASAQYNFKIKKGLDAYAGISIWNVLNKEYQINNYYRLSDTSVDQLIQSGLALTPNACFRVEF